MIRLERTIYIKKKKKLERIKGKTREHVNDVSISIKSFWEWGQMKSETSKRGSEKNYAMGIIFGTILYYNLS